MSENFWIKKIYWFGLGMQGFLIIYTRIILLFRGPYLGPDNFPILFNVIGLTDLAAVVIVIVLGTIQGVRLAQQKRWQIVAINLIIALVVLLLNAQALLMYLFMAARWH